MFRIVVDMVVVAEGPIGPVRIPMMPCCLMTVALEDQPDRLRSKKSQMWHLLLWSVLSCKPAMTRFFIVHTKAPLGRLCLSVCPSLITWHLLASHRVVIAAISRYISETVQSNTKVTIKCEYEVVCDRSNGLISNDLEW